MLRDLLTKVRKKGFDGPYYRGARGKLRFLLESTLWRHELVFVATPRSWGDTPRPEGGLVLHPIRRFADFEPWRAEVEAAFYPGYLEEQWRAPFTWGEEAVVGTVDGRVACYNWMQFGTPEGFPTYYGRMFETEARILRGGVLPEFRRLGLNTLMKHRLLERYFREGATRVYAECYERNIPSVRTLLKIGFQVVGRLRVLELPGGRGYVRWSSVEPIVDEFRAQGIELAPPPSR